MRRRTLAATAGVVVAAVGGAGIAVANATNDDDGTERPIAGDALDRATEAALAHFDGGRVTGTEVDDEDSKYEVEVTLEDGRQIDVQLDEDFNIVSLENDGSGEDDD